MLNFQPDWIPDVELDCDKVQRALEKEISRVSENIPREEARKAANFYIMMKLGDALCPAEMELLEIEAEPVWRVTVVHRRTQRRFGELHVAASGKKRVIRHPEPNLSG